MENLETKIKLYNELQEVFNNKVISLGPVRCDRLTELLGVWSLLLVQLIKTLLRSLKITAVR